MNILLLNSPIVWAGVKRPIFPLGLAYVGTSAANHGHNVRLIDLNICSNHLQKLEVLLQENRFEFIGVSMRSMFFNQVPQISQLKSVIKSIKSFSPYSKIICGGAAFSLMPEGIINSIEEIDIGVIGKGEEAFLELINKPPQEVRGIVYRDVKGIHFNPPREEVDLESLPIPKRDWPDLDLSCYDTLNIQTRLGCPFKCNYCKIEYLEGEKVRCRSISSVHKEIGYLNSLGIKKIFFADNVFNYPLEYSLEIMDMLRKYNLRWVAFFRPGLFNKDYSRRLLESNCETAIITAESGSQVTHNYLGTGISVDNVLGALSLLSSYSNDKITIVFTFMVGFQKEKMKDIFKTFILMIRILFKNYFMRISSFRKSAKISVSLRPPPVGRKIPYPVFLVLVLFDFIKRSKIGFKKYL